MEDMLWRTKQRLKILQESLALLQGIWSDQAQQELYTHFLLPHQDGSEQAILSLEEQVGALLHAQNEFSEVEKEILQAYLAGEKIQILIDGMQREMNDCWQLQEQYLRHTSAANTQLESLQEDIKRAQSCLE